MNDGYAWWLVIVGIAIGIALVWLVLVRLPRSEDDVAAAELPAEASWISQTIEAYGGIAPQPLVEEILELHRAWLAAGGGTPVVPHAPSWPEGGQGAEDAADRGRTAPRAG